MPLIYDCHVQLGYGGDQDWFEDLWAQKAGCASVLASNLYAFYMGKKECQLSEFIKIMEKMFYQMTPGYMGYPYLYKFARTFVKIMAMEGIPMKPIYQKRSKNFKHALTFLLNSIDEGHPVGMLILHHCAKELEEDNWHWICLNGYIQKDQGYDIIFSDCGERRVIDARVLFDTRACNVFKMVRMKKDPKE